MKTREEIKAALDNSELYLEYMPTMSLFDHRCVGAEALIRWLRSDEIISPLDFIPHVENTSLSGPITYWVIEQVARELGAWLRLKEDAHIAINIPPEALGQGALEYVAHKAGLAEVADQLIIEITERGFADRLALEALRSRGNTKIAVDDFGTGDANLMHLSQIAPDIIKIDKYFVDQIRDDLPIPKIVKGLVAFALAMDCELVAEGVESQIQIEVLKDLGVQMAQGWYFSKPLTAASFEDFFERHQGPPA